MLPHSGLGLCQKTYPVPSLDKLDGVVPLWELYLLKIRSPVVLREYKVGGSSGGVQENSRNHLEPLIEFQVGGDVY